MTTPEEIIAIQSGIDQVFGAAELHSYIVDLVRLSRQHEDLVLGASPRAAIFLMKAARAHALLRGLPYVTHEDIQSIALPVLGHRLILQPEAEMEGRQIADIVDELIHALPVLK